MDEKLPCSDFYDAYLPLILHYGKRHSLYEHEKEELVQSVLIDIFMGNMGYDPLKSKFSTFVSAIAKNNAIDIKRKRKIREVSFEQQSDLINTLDYDIFEKLWNAEWQEHILGKMLEELKEQIEPTTYTAFIMSVLEKHSPAEIAEQLSISENAVYVYKKRAIAKLRKIYRTVSNDNKKSPVFAGL